MNVFITGASGYIGNAIARAFSQAGHLVTGLVRSEKSALLLKSQEIMPLIGDMKDISGFAGQAAKADVIVHAAAELGPEKGTLDSATVNRLLEAAHSTSHQKIFIYTSGCWLHGQTHGKIVSEEEIDPIPIVQWRVGVEATLKVANSSRLHTVIFRPGFVFGEKGGLTSLWFNALDKGYIEMIGNGENHWSMVHIEDLARAYVLAAEKHSMGTYNLTDNHFFKVKEMVHEIAKITGKKIHTLSKEEAEKKLGPLTQGLTVDQKISSEKANKELGWMARHENFVQGLPRYLNAWEMLR